MIRSIALLFLTFASLSYAQEPVAPLQAAKDYLAKTYPADLPGAAVAIIKDGKPILVQGCGLADMASKAPITTETAFDLASCSKQFTALAVQLLAERKQLSLDDPVKKYLPELALDSNEVPITIRHLLNHTSGLPDYLNFFKGETPQFAKLEQIEANNLLKGQKLLFAPGTRWAYSNTNYALLPLIVTKLTGMPFGVFSKKEIFEPLGMTHSVIMDNMDTPIPHRATGYGWKDKKWQLSRLDGPICGDGNLFTTIEDMIKWDAGVAARKIVSAERWKECFTPAKLSTGKMTTYGLGWMINTKPVTGTEVSHGGGWSGTNTYIARWEEHGLTVIVLSNREASLAGTNANAVGNYLAKLYLPKK